MYQRPGRGIRLNMAGPSQPSGALARRVLAVLLALAITVLAVAQYRSGRGPVVVAWLAVGPLLGSLLLRPLVTAVLAGWATLLGAGLIVDQPARPGSLVSHLGVCVLLAAFAVANSVLRTAGSPFPRVSPISQRVRPPSETTSRMSPPTRASAAAET